VPGPEPVAERFKTRVYLSIFTAIFPGEPGLASFIEAKNDGSGDEKELLCKAPVRLSLPTNQHQTYLQARCPSCLRTNSVKALRGKYLKHKHIVVVVVAVDL